MSTLINAKQCAQHKIKGVEKGDNCSRYIYFRLAVIKHMYIIKYIVITYLDTAYYSLYSSNKLHKIFKTFLLINAQ